MEKTGPALFGDVLHKPNVVLIHLGTNDLGAWHEEPYDTAPERLGKLMNLILFGARNTTVIVAKIIQGSQGKEINKPERITIFNEGVQKQVDSRAASGFKIMAVDMSMIGVDGEDLNDGLHPNEEGYRKMAIKWYEGMKEISDKGWISNVEDINNPYSTNAEDVSANVALAKANMEIEFN
jgi:lysophospholipase L1-like esterase